MLAGHCVRQMEPSEINEDISYVVLVLSQKQNKILLGDKLSPVIKQGFLRSEENINLNNFPTLDGV